MSDGDIIEQTIVKNDGCQYIINSSNPIRMADFEQMLPKLDGNKAYFEIGPRGKLQRIKCSERIRKGVILEDHSAADPELYEKVTTESVMRIIKYTHEMGYDNPAVVQGYAVPALLSRVDCLIESKSGTGKTMGFTAGTLAHFDVENPKLQMVYITSSHEVAKQILDVVKGMVPGHTKTALCIGYNKGSNGSLGKVPNIRERIKMASEAQIIVGTMGNFFDFTDKKVINFDYLKSFVVDEYDSIVSGNSYSKDSISTSDQLEMIISLFNNDTQRVFVTATSTAHSRDIISKYVRTNISAGKIFGMTLKEDDCTLDGIRQFYKIMRQDCFLTILVDILMSCRFDQVMIFVNEKNTLYRVADYIVENGVDKESIGVFHGEMSSAERTEMYTKYSNNLFRIMITTDVNSRGVDFQGVSLVINYDMPRYLETYIHRVGRSGRFGRKGCAISFIQQDGGVDGTKFIEDIDACSEINKMKDIDTINLSELIQ